MIEVGDEEQTRRGAFGDKLRAARQRAGISSAEELGAEMGVSGSAVSAWERGQATPRYNRLVWLEQRFGIPGELTGALGITADTRIVDLERQVADLAEQLDELKQLVQQLVRRGPSEQAG